MFDWGLPRDRGAFSTIWTVALVVNLGLLLTYQGGWVEVTEAGKHLRAEFAWGTTQIAALAAAPVAWLAGLGLLWKSRTDMAGFVGGAVSVSAPILLLLMGAADLVHIRFAFHS